MDKYMKQAYDEALAAQREKEVPVGAAIYRKGELIASAHNRMESQKDPTAHAEMLAIRKALSALQTKSLSDCSLYVTLEPCAMCLGAIHHAKVGKLYFGAYDTQSGACGGKVDLAWSGCFPWKTEVYGGIAEPECEALLTNFFQAMRKGGKPCDTAISKAGKTSGQ